MLYTLDGYLCNDAATISSYRWLTSEFLYFSDRVR